MAKKRKSKKSKKGSGRKARRRVHGTFKSSHGMLMRSGPGQGGFLLHH